MSIKVGVLGACGRMGQAIIAALAEQEGATLSAAAEHSGHAQIGQSIGTVRLTQDVDAVMQNSDVVIDFTTPAALRPHLDSARSHKTPFVVGTTGLDPHHFDAMTTAARQIPLLYSANMSVGVNLLALLVEQAAAQLTPDWDIEIFEMHHRHKVDAPSGTALLLGRAAAQGRGVHLADVEERGRDGITGARKPGNIGFASLRGGSVAGDHSVIFAADQERIELIHRAESRDIFARGALRAGLWLSSQPAGQYGLRDMLFSRSKAD
jgi:4-hydroxy-tetrahydrodipicolinate reductase